MGPYDCELGKGEEHGGGAVTKATCIYNFYDVALVGTYPAMSTTHQ